MVQIVSASPILFEVVDVFGKRIRTTERWWMHIVSEKHEEVRERVELVKQTIVEPREVRQSDEKPYIYLYYKEWKEYWVCAVARHLNGDGFLMTAYITTKKKKKGNLVWQRNE